MSWLEKFLIKFQRCRSYRHCWAYPGRMLANRKMFGWKKNSCFQTKSSQWKRWKGYYWQTENGWMDHGGQSFQLQTLCWTPCSCWFCASERHVAQESLNSSRGCHMKKSLNTTVREILDACMGSDDLYPSLEPIGNYIKCVQIENLLKAVHFAEAI